MIYFQVQNLNLSLGKHSWIFLLPNHFFRIMNRLNWAINEKITFTVFLLWFRVHRNRAKMGVSPNFGRPITKNSIKKHSIKTFLISGRFSRNFESILKNLHGRYRLHLVWWRAHITLNVNAILNFLYRKLTKMFGCIVQQ